jgi:DNA modification methylase
MNVVYNMDCTEYMKTLPDKAFELAIVDYCDDKNH